MAGISYDGCRTSGHGSAEPTKILSTKQNFVFINGKSVLINGDEIIPHNYEDDPPHDGSVIAETTLMYISGVPVSKIGDMITCGDMVSEASDFVFIND